MKILLLIFSIFLTSISYASTPSQQALAWPSKVPTFFCQPNDANQNCGGSGGGSATPGGSQGNIQFLDVQGTVTKFGGNSGLYYSGTGSTAGNVGIGSANPGQLLDVAGTVRAQYFAPTLGPYTDLSTIPGATPNNSSVDNQPAIAECLGNATSECFVPDGVWYINAEIFIPTISFYQGKHLVLARNAVIKLMSTFSAGAAISIGNQSGFEGGALDVSAVTGGFSGVDFYSPGSSQAGNGTSVHDTQVIDTNYTSIGIEFFSNSGATNDSVYSMNIYNIAMFEVNEGINLTAGNGFVNQNVNSTQFHNIFIVGFNYGIYINQQAGANAPEVYANHFTDIYMEGFNRSGAIALYCSGGWANFFTNIDLWDVPTGYDFVNNAQYNMLGTWQELINAGGSPTVNVRGSLTNRIEDFTDPVFGGLVSIGTTNQSNTLNVDTAASGHGVAIGNATYVDTSAPSGGLILSGSVGIDTYLPNTSNAMSIFGRLSLGSAAAAVATAPINGAIISGNVGIGTTLPGANGLSVATGVSIGSVTYAATAAPSGGLLVSGNVGIGSVNPAAKMDVNGSVRMTAFNLSTSPTNGYYLKTDASGNGSWAAVSGSGTVNTGTNNYVAYYTGSTAVSSTPNLQIVGSNVGVGSSLPGQLLDVAGTVRANNFSTTLNNYVNYFQIPPWSSSNQPGIPINTGTGGLKFSPGAGTIVSATISGTLNGSTCSAVVDIWKINAAIPTVANTITASDLPTLSSSSYSQDTTLSGWTTSVSANDVFLDNVQSNTCDTLSVVLWVKE